MQTKEEIVAAFDKVIHDVTQAREDFIAGKPIAVWGAAKDLRSLDNEMSLRDIKADMPNVEQIELESEPESCDDGTWVDCLSHVGLIAGDKSYTLYHPDGGIYEPTGFSEFLGVSEEAADAVAERVWDRCECLASNSQDGQSTFALQK